MWLAFDLTPGCGLSRVRGEPMIGFRRRFRRVTVSGPSMVPALRPGDLVLARDRVPVRRGDVVLARFRDMPGRLVVKRAARPADGGWWLVSDNPYAGGDSAVHGAADVEARVVLILRPGRPRRVPRPAGTEY